MSDDLWICKRKMHLPEHDGATGFYYYEPVEPYIAPGTGQLGLEEAAMRVCAADGNDWNELSKTYNGRQQQHTYRALARAALFAPKNDAGEITGETSDGYHTFNELYEHRHILFLAVLTANIAKAWRSKLHADGTMFDGWFIAGLNTDDGQATYHIPERMWELFKYIPELDRAPEWDGHTSNDVLVRIRDMAFFNGVKHTTPPSPREGVEDLTDPLAGTPDGLVSE